ncbi:hypothetical protein, partial [Vibrio parahaemolyticus]
LYKEALDEIKDIFYGPLILILCSLAFSICSREKIFFGEAVGALIPNTLYIISSIVFLFYFLPKLSIKNNKIKKESAIKGLQFGMGIIRAFTAFSMLILGIMILNYSSPSLEGIHYLYMSGITLFLLYVNIFNKVIINNSK